MRLPSRAVALAAAALAVAACGSGGAGRTCTMIGTMPGLRLVVPAPSDADRIATASLKVCWDGKCQEPRVELRPTTAAVSTGCDGDGPDAVCGASASPDGGKAAFARVEGLPKAPVRVTVRLRDAAGRTVLDRTLDVTPAGTFPNGPGCGEGSPQAVLTVKDGRISAS